MHYFIYPKGTFGKELGVLFDYLRQQGNQDTYEFIDDSIPELSLENTLKRGLGESKIMLASNKVKDALLSRLKAHGISDYVDGFAFHNEKLEQIGKNVAGTHAYFRFVKKNALNGQENSATQESELFKEIRARKFKSMSLLTLASCNYACGMCPYYGEGYDGDYFAERKSIKRTMSLDEIRLLLQKAKDAGIEQINLTPNGEFFLHKQWREILRLTKEFGLQTVITSNGGLLSEEDIKEICEIGIDRITISIDSLNYDHYKIIRKPATHAAYTRAINAPILFKKYNPKIYVQVQATEQPNLMPNNDMQEILDFYKKAKLNQINVNKMFKGSNEKMMHYGAKRGKYIHGTCKGYGNPIVLPDGKVVPCCGGYYFYTRIEEHIPNVLQETTLKEAMKRIDDLYEFNDIFRNYCKNCSLYDANNDKSERVFVFENYFATQTEITTRYFLLPIYLRPLPAGLILWLYKKGYARKIKQFLAKFGL